MTEGRDLYTALAGLTDDELDELVRLDNGLADDEAFQTTDEDYRPVTIERHALMRVKLCARSVDRPPIQVLGELVEDAIADRDGALGREAGR
jgi:hypothetical protein